MNLVKEFLELVKIQAPSGKEAPVRNFLKRKLMPKNNKSNHLVDEMIVDEHGNLLAEKKCGTGEGATVILSAHMDTVSFLDKDRKIVYDKNNDTVYSTKGILGADDRAGIAIILNVLRNIPETFNGNIHVSFSVEEERGCVGANKIDQEWIKKADLAIVIDRKGNRDIVHGTWGTPFCDTKVGEFFENLLPEAKWVATDGGISDACSFSKAGVNSVNLSAGYYNEHTAKEFAIMHEMFDTRDLVLHALLNVNSHYKGWGSVPAPKTYYYEDDDWGYGYRKNNPKDWEVEVLTNYSSIGLKKSAFGSIYIENSYSSISIEKEYALELAEALHAMAQEMIIEEEEKEQRVLIGND
jgi:di/tripeptidase